MEKILNDTEDILDCGICGFHKYVLTEPVHLCYVSRNLCDMTGFSKSELASDTQDMYEQMVHPADIGIYRKFIRDIMSPSGQTVCAEYRLIKKDGSVIFVRDTAVPMREKDGTPVCCCVLTDITDIKNENDNLHFLNDTTPCGFLKYTCEKQPRITYINQQMKDFLHFSAAEAGEADYLELCRDNIFLMIPMEDRRRFALYLNRVYSAGMPMVGEVTLLCCDGEKVRVFGWVTKCVNDDGSEEFQCVCMDITERYKAVKADETRRYIKALTDVYDKIFEYNLAQGTVKCLYSNNSPMFEWLENIPMQQRDATEKWISETAVSEDCDRLRAFFESFYRKELYRTDEQPPQISYRAKSSSGEIKNYRGIFLKMDESVSLYCCRRLPDTEETDIVRSEDMHELMMRFTDGIAAFEITDHYVTPLYASDNVCEFFGFTKEEWLPLMKQSTPIKDFVSRGSATYEEIRELLRTGEAEFTYFDLKTGSERRIKAISSQKSPGKRLRRYVMLYNIDDDADTRGQSDDRTVLIRTFGYFDVFVGKKPIAFRSKKAKELFALLVDRRGGFISSEEAIGFLWEDEPISSVTLARYRKTALRLKNTLEEYGISDVMESVHGKRRIVPEKVQCDLYNYLSGKEEYSQLFKGSYLSNYSWGENTLAGLQSSMTY